VVISLHPCIETPKDDVKIWKYLSTEKFLSLLINSSLYFSRIDQFSDSLEGTWPKALSQWNAFQDEAVRENVRKVLLDFNKTFFVNCWCMSECESNLMWGQYGTIAISSTVGRLKRCLEPLSTHFYIGKVEYIDFANDPYPFQDINQYRLLYWKRQEFQGEKELRVMCHQPEIYKGAPLLINLQILVESIVCSENLEDWLVETLRSLLTKLGLADIDLRKSDIAQRPYL
jgi:hypothetical protein